MTLDICQVPTKEAPSLPDSARVGRENVTKVSWFKIRAGHINQVRFFFLKFQSLVSLQGGNRKAEVCKSMACPTVSREGKREPLEQQAQSGHVALRRSEGSGMTPI